MAIRRYSLILRRWLWLLIIVGGCAALLSWFFVTHTRTHYDPRLIVSLVTLGGLAWGLAGIFGIEYLRDHIKTVEDIEYITSVPLLGIITTDPRRENEALFEGPQTLSAEVYRAISRHLLADVNRDEGSALLICSPQAAPQAARVSANIAAAAARFGYSTLLIDANRQESDVTKSLNLSGAAGFADALLNRSSDVPIHVVPALSNLHVLPAGVPPLSQPLSFANVRLQEVLNPSRGHRSLVVVAGPPINSQSHWLALELANVVDKVVLLVVIDSTKRSALKRTVISLHETNARPGGIIVVARKTSKRRDKWQAVGSGFFQRLLRGLRLTKPNLNPGQQPAFHTAGANIQSTDNADRRINELLLRQAEAQRISALAEPPNGFAPSVENVEADPATQEELSMEAMEDKNQVSQDHALNAVASGSSAPPSVPRPTPDPQLSEASQINLSDLDSLGSGSSLEEPNITLAMDLSGLDSLADELVRETPRRTTSSEPSKRIAEPVEPEQPAIELPEPIPITSARRHASVAPTRPAAMPAFSYIEAPLEAPVEDVAPVETPTTPDQIEPAAFVASPIVESARPAILPAVEPARPVISPPVEAALPSLSPPVEKEKAREAIPAASVASRTPATATIPIPVVKVEPIPTVKVGPSLPEPADADSSNQPPRLIALGAKWMAARSISRANASARGQEPQDNIFTRIGDSIGLAFARAIRAMTGRSSVETREDQSLQRSGVVGSLPAVSTSTVVQSATASTGDQRLFELWLNAAEHARIRGNRKEAKALIDKVLDRDPHNDAAWQLRLRLAEPAMVQPARNVRAVRQGPRAGVVWLVILLFVGLIGVGGYFGRTKISNFVSSFGNQSASPTPSWSPVPTGTSGAQNYEISAQFSSYWNSNKAVFGETISPLLVETDSTGKDITVQYFSRARLELHPKNNGTEFDVMVGRLGSEVSPSGTIANPLPEGLRGDQTTFKETGISTPPKFNAFWVRNGGAAIFGFPITPVLYDAAPDGKKLAVQYFERARFEYHPEYAGTDKEVQLTDLGPQALHQKHGGK